MKKEYYTDETFLARWIENDLSTEELKQFKNSEEYHQFKKINDATKLLKVPDYNLKDAFSTVSEKIAHKKKSTKILRLKPTWLYSAVASIILFLTIFYLNNDNNTVFSTTYGEKMVVTLPDNSVAHLSPLSSLKFKKNNWNNKRSLSLTGTAYFEVEKGQSFTVSTNEGNVVVLGTKFTVNTSNNFIEVQCFEGSVKVTSKNNKKTILTKGEAFRSYKNKSENWKFYLKKPLWVDGESNFNNAPLSKVILALEKQYNLKINTSKVNINKRFTGTFTHKNVNIALKTVFAPMKISFKLAKNSSVILKSDE